MRIIANAHAASEIGCVDVVNPGPVDLRMAQAAHLPAGKIVAAPARVCSESRAAEAAAVFPGRRAREGDDKVRQIPTRISGRHIRVGRHGPRLDAGGQAQPNVQRPAPAPECPWRGKIAGEYSVARPIVEGLAAAAVVAMTSAAALADKESLSAGHALRRTWNRSGDFDGSSGLGKRR